MSNRQQNHRHSAPGPVRLGASPSPGGREALSQRRRRGVLFRWGVLLLCLFLSFYFLRGVLQPEQVIRPAVPVVAVPPPVSSAMAAAPVPSADESVTMQAPPSGVRPSSVRIVARPVRKKQPVAGSLPVAVPENPPVQMVYGTTLPGEENPFLPEESHAGTPPATQQCEDETIPAVMAVPAVSDSVRAVAAPADSVVAHPVDSKPERGTSKRHRSKKQRKN